MFNVLIVDDSPVMRAVVGRVLEMSGFPIRERFEAGDGVEALKLLSGQSVDVIITDINMPNMDGEELVRRLESDESLRHIPVLVVSTDASEHRVRQMLAMGAKGYVKKPFVPERIREELEKVMGVTYAS
jgi:two-component system chemotaxis response regulator CheY